MEHKIEIKAKGEGMDELMTPVCSCGWRGIGYEAHNDWQWKNVQDQINGHLTENSVNPIRSREARMLMESPYDKYEGWKDGKKVIAYDKAGKPHRRYFHAVGRNCKVLCYKHGATKWSNEFLTYSEYEYAEPY